MKFYIFILTLFTFSCGNFNEVEIIPSDLIPPFLESIKVVNSRTLQIICNEEINLNVNSFSSREGYVIESVENVDKSISITFDRELSPGFEYCSEFRIEDKNRNSLSFISNYYGYNSELPNVIINEFMCRGSNSNPDKVELYVLEGGNMAGLTIFNGTKESNDSKFVFPPIVVNKGEYIVIRSISDNYPTPFIELEDLNVEHDKKFIPDIRDVRVPEFSLSTTNGVVSVYDNPYGEPIDAVVFSKNVNDETKNYRNFGLSKVLARIDSIAKTGLWFGESETIFPEDTVFIDNSTTTRTLNRRLFLDSNTNKEWYTVASREESFGYENSLIEYVVED